MKREFPKAYQPGEVEQKWYDCWLNNKLFAPDDNITDKHYSILMPPPNVTGILHFGHVLNQTLQDIYTRYKRMTGYNVCWFPGTDHAGIATQTRVEKELKAEGLTRYDLGREKFIERVWTWREKYGGIILQQLRRLGISCDWDKTLFTMDESASNAVSEVFIRLFDEGLIYRGKRIINWSPLAQTALSDEEVEFREVKEHLYTLRYNFPDASGYLCVATVRPETIFGDVAVAVNPEDERYKHLIGKTVIVPLAGREVPIIADDYADPRFGTGCVKITPAHDPNDFLVGQRHNLEMPNSINPDGTLNELTGEFNGMERFAARKKILAKLQEDDLVEKIDDYTHNVGYSQRGGEPVEPYLSDQWFVDMKPLANEALQVVLDGDVKFYPNHWHKTYEHWMTNIRDWCISRQLWWGHRIPVYYAEDGRYTAARSESEARKKLGLPDNASLTQDNDVLDTWFSSWLWPMTTMNWLHDKETETTPDMEKYLPTDLLVTAPDIIFFWVARMIMASKKFKKQIPFRDVYFTSTIRDGQGRKLSKSLGNSPDPLNIIDKYGADAVRFTTIYLSPLGQDVRMDVDVQAQDIPTMELGRNFANKIWNAGRFLLMKRDAEELQPRCPDCGYPVLKEQDFTFADKWIRSRLNTTIQKLAESLDNYNVTEFSRTLYDFIWRDFCDWYVEIVKVQVNQSDDSHYRIALIDFAVGVYETALSLLHPVMPFITEEIWHLLDGSRSDNQSISVQRLPEADAAYISSEIESDFEYVQLIVEEIRRMRSSISIPPSEKVPVIITNPNSRVLSILNEQSKIIASLAKCSKIEIAETADKPERALASVVRETQIFVIPSDSFDVEKEKERINKEIQRLENNIRGCNAKLNNSKFVDNAPKDIVDYERKKLADMESSLEKVRENLRNLG